MLFTEAPTEPLRGWVTLANAIRQTRDLQDAVPKIRLHAKTNSPIEDMKRGNPSRKKGPRENGWTMIPDRTLEEKSYVSLARNRGY